MSETRTDTVIESIKEHTKEIKQIQALTARLADSEKEKELYKAALEKIIENSEAAHVEGYYCGCNQIAIEALAAIRGGGE